MIDDWAMAFMVFSEGKILVHLCLSGFTPTSSRSVGVNVSLFGLLINWQPVEGRWYTAFPNLQ